ncbi:MAG TPA: glycerophosphodiester phosphodiesterase family protein [Chloroflexi bacterium]|nr:glycerophosphodiester phosphodiesterase family protein [Chloroflexota bacterium]
MEIVCHKGANHVAPENTYAAAEAALNQGASWVEADVWTSRDGEMVVIHDATVDRTTNGSGYVLQLTTDELAKLDAGSWFHSAFAGERIPVLREFLQWMRGRGKVFLDVKFAHPQQLLDLIYASGMVDSCFLWSASELWMSLVHELDPTMPLKVNVEIPAQVEIAQETFGAQIVEVPAEKLSYELVQTCRARGLKLMALCLDHDARSFRDLLRWQPDMVNLDRLDVFLQVADELQSSRVRRGLL